MKRIILEIEPSTLETIDKVFKEQIRELENKLTKWRLKVPNCTYDEELKKQIIEETLKEIGDLKLHRAAILKAYHYEHNFA